MTPSTRHEHTHRFHHRLPSTFEGINEAVDRLTNFIKEIELETNFFTLIFLMREALNNAVIHGNKMNPAKEVEVNFLVEGGNISITIIDEGEGFKWRKITRQHPASIEKTSGRGVYYLQKYDYNMRYNDKGNILYLSKETTC